MDEDEIVLKCFMCDATSSSEGNKIPSSFSYRDDMCDICHADTYADYDEGEHWTTAYGR